MLQDQVWVLREPGSGTRAFSDYFIRQFSIIRHQDSSSSMAINVFIQKLLVSR